MKKQKSPRPPRIACLAVPKVHASSLYGGYEMFKIAGLRFNTNEMSIAGERSLDPVIVGPSCDFVLGWNDVKIAPEFGVDDVGPVDAIFIPSIGAIDEKPPVADPNVLAWINNNYKAGSIIATACMGTFFLAGAGLLNGERATTHWAFSEDFKSSYPQVALQKRSGMSFAGEGHRIITAGGGSMWMDLVLFLITKFVSHEAAVQISKLYLVDWARDDQLVYACLEATNQHSDQLIQRSQRVIAEALTDANVLSKARAISGLPDRTFERRFKAATGIPAVKYVQQLRVELAKRILEETQTPTEEIALAVGYSDPTSFRRLFIRLVGVTPSDYRKRFGRKWPTVEMTA
ncbi:GlxA family transcriptional regulator [Hoeflea sp. TYP-13]|uniref:GlxA family transcriptional regulator n=1 Tax=Hoeflea sp. TYP-13 TaxID=3230023 RepID=UPI0034C61121